MPFNPNLHPRAGGGKFGQANNAQQLGQQAAKQFKDQLLKRAIEDDRQIGLLQAEERQLRAALPGAAAGAPRSHTVPKKSASKVAKGSKSGVAKKTHTVKSGKAAASKMPSIPSTKAGIRSRLIIVTGTIHALQQDAAKCHQLASQL